MIPTVLVLTMLSLVGAEPPPPVFKATASAVTNSVQPIEPQKLWKSGLQPSRVWAQEQARSQAYLPPPQDPPLQTGYLYGYQPNNGYYPNVTLQTEALAAQAAHQAEMGVMQGSYGGYSGYGPQYYGYGGRYRQPVTSGLGFQTILYRDDGYQDYGGGYGYGGDYCPPVTTTGFNTQIRFGRSFGSSGAYNHGSHRGSRRHR